LEASVVVVVVVVVVVEVVVVEGGFVNEMVAAAGDGCEDANILFVAAATAAAYAGENC